MTIVVCYHYPCADGIWAALAAHKKLGNDGVTYMPLRNNMTVAETESFLEAINVEDSVYLLDTIGSHDLPQKLCEKVEYLVILDHHQTTNEYFTDRSLTKAKYHLLWDPVHSGAMLAWEYFKPDFGKQQEDLWKMFSYVQDHDLWAHKLPNSKEFAAGFAELGLEYDFDLNPDIFNQLQNLKFDEVLKKGQEALYTQEQKIKGLLNQSFRVVFVGPNHAKYMAAAVYCFDHKIRSELGARLAQQSKAIFDSPLGAIIWKEGEKFQVSLRSIDNFDTTVISKFYGGGGHPGASGFVLTWEQHLHIKA